MKNQILNLALVASAAFFFACSGAKTDQAADTTAVTEPVAAVADGQYTLDTASVVKWVATKVTGAHDGTVALKSGSFTLAAGNITAGAFELDMTTIKALDLAGDPETQAKLEGHLKADDFFAADKFPTATFTLTSVAPATDGVNTHVLSGDLAIKGISNPVSIPVVVAMENNMVKVTGAAKLDRTLWDIKFRSAKFFSDLGDKMINDEFTISFELAGAPATAAM